ncbi:hypothetical protein Ccrd_006550 [Cynara cardunculus var. scolymus]|uniref:Protein FAR1-RELATED SEQUENCE n=1 Tax=Cynara cardunculus var. scolymus TaxID=59895 RepID=A0A103XIS0_CYNCS|nr:hypothetical protein Ccrd_006550 [Cynara cardunculus var. scolymus]
MNRQDLGNTMTVRAKPGLAAFKTNGQREDEGESRMDPYVGLEFDSAEAAQEFYNSYATQIGFKIRIGQLYRSRVDGSVVSRRYVCSKEGFQTNSRTGCPAFIRVQKGDSGKWVLANIKKEHNHDLDISGEVRTPTIQRKVIPAPKTTSVVSSRTGIRSLEDDGPSGVIDLKRLKREELEAEPRGEPCKGLDFISANEAYKFYYTYAANMGFKVRIGQLFRSKNDGSITSRRFVCSKEGHQHPSRVGCGAFMRIQRQDSGRWVVDRLSKEHNHELDSPEDAGRKIAAAAKGFKEELSSGLENLDLLETNGGLSLVKRDRGSGIGSRWYSVLLEYFQSRQAEDTGFFYALESQTASEFDSAWSVLVTKYNIKENAWLKEMYKMRKSWVPLYLRGIFFAGIPVDGSMKSYFGTFLTSQVPLNEFLMRYEKATEHHREEERKEDFNSFNLQTVLHTKDPLEEQCRRLYTITVFKVALITWFRVDKKSNMRFLQLVYGIEVA